MKEDLSIARDNILSLQDENRQLKKDLGIEVKDSIEVYMVARVFDENLINLLLFCL